jgi:restriction endonuclease S subunit
MQTQLVKKTAIIDSGDFNLSANRYLEKVEINSDYETVKISQIAEHIRGLTFSRKDRLEKSSSSTIKVATTKAAQSKGLVEKDLYIINKNLLKNKTKILVKNDILISIANSLHLVGRTTFIKNISETITFGAFMSLIRVNSEKINPVLLNYFLKSNYAKEHFLSQAKTTTNISNLSSDAILNFEIPLPPLEIQEQIVEEIEGYQQIIDGCRQVVDNYKPVIDIDPSWDSIELGDIVENLDNLRKPISKANRKSGPYPYYGSTRIVDYVDDYIFDEKLVLFGEDGAKWGSFENSSFIIEGKTWVNNHAHVLKPNREIILDLFLSTQLNNQDLSKYITGVTVPKINQKMMNQIKISIPSMEIQKEIVEKLEQERKVIEGNKELIKIYEDKINARINKVWSDN